MNAKNNGFMAKKIVVNNEETIVECANVSELAQHLQLPERGVALAVNNRVVPRTAWTETVLDDGDSVTIIKAAFGG